MKDHMSDGEGKSLQIWNRIQNCSKYVKQNVSDIFTEAVCINRRLGVSSPRTRGSLQFSINQGMYSWREANFEGTEEKWRTDTAYWESCY